MYRLNIISKVIKELSKFLASHNHVVNGLVESVSLRTWLCQSAQWCVIVPFRCPVWGPFCHRFCPILCYETVINSADNSPEGYYSPFGSCYYCETQKTMITRNISGLSIMCNRKPVRYQIAKGQPVISLTFVVISYWEKQSRSMQFNIICRDQTESVDEWKWMVNFWFSCLLV